MTDLGEEWSSWDPLRYQLRKKVLLLLCWAQSSTVDLESTIQSHGSPVFGSSSQRGQPYLPSTGLVLDVVDGADLGAHVLQIRSGSVDGARVSGSAGHRGFLLQRGLLGNWRFGDDTAAMCSLTIGGSSWSGGCSGGNGSTGWRRKEVCGCLQLLKNLLRTLMSYGTLVLRRCSQWSAKAECLPEKGHAF